MKAALGKGAMLLMGIATIAYPATVYFGMGRLEPFWLGVALLALMGVRALLARDAVWLLAGAGAALVAMAGMVANSWVPLKLYPFAVNAVLLAVFAASLWRGASLIERIARLSEPQLTPAAVAYTRRVTIVWCAFLAVNGALALATALWASNAIWALYNGLIAYVLIGLLFGAEWLVRKRVRAAHLAKAQSHV
jgi:uncharacterized membrane protein